MIHNLTLTVSEGKWLIAEGIIRIPEINRVM